MKTSVAVEKLEHSRVKLRVEVPADEVENAMERTFQRLRPRLRIPGFRPGKAPRSIVEMRLGKDYLLREALDDLINDAYREALRQENLEPVAEPDVHLDKVEVGAPVVFEADVSVRPEVTLGEYHGLQVQRPLTKVTDADVEAGLRVYQQRQAELVPVTDRPVKRGDTVLIDYQGLVGGRPFHGGAARDYSLQVGAGEFLPQLEDALVGMKAGETREIPVRFPADYSNAELADKDATFTVTVKEIKTLKLPELNDEFARSVGDYETLEQLRQHIRESLLDQAARRADQAAEEAAVKQLVERSQVDVPEAMVEQEVDSRIRNLQLRLAYQGIRLEDYLTTTKQTMEQLHQQLRPDALEFVKAQLCLEAVAKEEGLEPSPDEVEKATHEEAAETARRTGSTEEKALTYWKSEGGQETIRRSLRIQKGLRFLMDHAQVQTVEIEPPASPAGEQPAAAPAEAASATEPAKESAPAAEPPAAAESGDGPAAPPQAEQDRETAKKD
ncbi:MAG: trigger factor [Limnochordaceae bacterium]|nr:trigger factor [Limnochordaceae bacterium]